MWKLLLKIFLALAIYAAGIEPRFVARDDQPGEVPNLPASWEGKQIAVFADLQVGMWWANTDAARRLVHTVVAVHPAAVLMVGDFVYEADSSVDDQMLKVRAIIQPILDAGIPTYAVLGNHDYSLMNESSDQANFVARKVHDQLAAAGVHMMDNRAERLPPDSSVYLVGIGEKWAKNDHVDDAFAQVPAGAPRIAFMHDPDTFAHIPAGEAPLAVAAHTHGMQVGIPYLSDWLWRHYFSDEGSGVEGWIANYGAAGNHVYVNRGVGFSIVPARLFAPPQLTIFTLRRPK